MADSKPDAEAPLSVSNKEYLLEAKIQDGIEARNSGQPERIRLLASKDRLDLGDWVEIVGVGIKDAPRYTISAEGVFFDVWDEEFIDPYPSHEQSSMARQNGEPGLLFPCTPRELLDFVECGIGRLFGSFLVPEEFKLAVKELHAKNVAGKGSKKRPSWDYAMLQALYKESLMPGITQTSLGKKHGVSRQRIGTLLRAAKEKFGAGNRSSSSHPFGLTGLNKGTKY